MLEILKTVLPSPEQMEMVIEGMRNPMNSWDKSDSYCTYVEDPQTLLSAPFEHFVGKHDLDLMRRLAAGGAVHAKYRRMMPVFVTINAPLYWWKEFDTYKVGTVANSCSTMHKIQDKEFTLEDFSYDHLIDDREFCWRENIMAGSECMDSPKEMLLEVIHALNIYREKYLIALKTEEHTGYSAKDIWWQMIQLLPSSYNQRRTVLLNYEVLTAIYRDRRNHKLDEWHTFCDWIENLPYFGVAIRKTTAEQAEEYMFMDISSESFSRNTEDGQN